MSRDYAKNRLISLAGIRRCLRARFGRNSPRSISRRTLALLTPRVAAVSFMDNARRGSSRVRLSVLVVLMFPHVSARHGNLSIVSIGYPNLENT